MDQATQKLIEKKREKVSFLMHEVAALACPFNVGDFIRKPNSKTHHSWNDYKPDIFRIEEIHTCLNKEGYWLTVRRVGIFGDLTMQYRRLMFDLDQYELVEMEEV